jgi:hypothetical protein
LLGDTPTAKSPILALHSDDRCDELRRRAFRARPAATLRREQQPVLSFHEFLMEANDSGRLEHDGAANESKRGDAGRTQSCDYPIHRSQPRGALARSIQDEQLVLEQHRLCDHGTRSAAAEQLHQRSNQVE